MTEPTHFIDYLVLRHESQEKETKFREMLAKKEEENLRMEERLAAMTCDFAENENLMIERTTEYADHFRNQAITAEDELAFYKVNFPS